MQNIEQIMQTPFNEAIQSVWVISVILIAISYIIGIYQCRRCAKLFMEQNFHRYKGSYCLDSFDKWLLCFFFLVSPIWAPGKIIGVGILRGFHALVTSFADKVLTPKEEK